MQNNNDDTIVVILTKNMISMLKSTNSLLEKVDVNDNLLMEHEIIEKRPFGVIYSIINKRFESSSRFNNKVVLVDLDEQRLVFSNDKLANLTNNTDISLCKYLVYINSLKNKVNLNKECDYYSNFSTHMNYIVYNNYSGKRFIDNFYPTRTYLNGENVSSIFDVSDSANKLYKVYDLYHGIIKPRDEGEVWSINMEFLTPDSYDLKTLKGITECEDKIVGKTLNNDNDYLNYLRGMLYKKFGFNRDLELNRDSILSGITYQMSQLERVSKIVEDKLGISYEEYESLDFDARNRLIKKKMGKELRFVDLNNDYVIKSEQINKRRVDKLSRSNDKKKVLSKIFRKDN